MNQTEFAEKTIELASDHIEKSVCTVQQLSLLGRMVSEYRPEVHDVQEEAKRCLEISKVHGWGRAVREAVGL